MDKQKYTFRHFTHLGEFNMYGSSKDPAILIKATNEPYVRITSDGKLFLHPNISNDELAKAFWKAVEEHYITENTLLKSKLKRIGDMVNVDNLVGEDPEDLVNQYVITTKKRLYENK